MVGFKDVKPILDLWSGFPFEKGKSLKRLVYAGFILLRAYKGKQLKRLIYVGFTIHTFLKSLRIAYFQVLEKSG